MTKRFISVKEVSRRVGLSKTHLYGKINAVVRARRPPYRLSPIVSEILPMTRQLSRFRSPDGVFCHDN